MNSADTIDNARTRRCPRSRHWPSHFGLRASQLVLPLSLFVLLTSTLAAWAATPGLPFTEDFSADNLMDPAGTNANWNTVGGVLQLPYAKKVYGAFAESTTTASNIGTETDMSTCLAVGDVNHDGWKDLVVGNSNAPNRVYLNDGDGDPFDSATVLDLTSDAGDTRGVAVGDVDDDGDMDLVVGNAGGQSNRLYLNDGTGAGWTGSNITEDAYDTRAVVLADVDGDGFLDLVAGNYAEQNFVYLSDGTAAPWGALGSGAPITSDAHHIQSKVPENR